MGASCISAVAGLERRQVIGVGELAVSNDQDLILTTYSLGSCLGVTIYDPVRRVGGLLHAMLPDSSINMAKAAEQPAMFVDTGIGALFRAAYALKADKHRMQICVAGGAQFFDKNGFFNIGQRNYACLLQLLAQHDLVIEAQDVGGLVSRTLHLNIANGEVRLKSSGQSEETILCQSHANIG